VPGILFPGLPEPDPVPGILFPGLPEPEFVPGILFPGGPEPGFVPGSSLPAPPAPRPPPELDAWAEELSSLEGMRASACRRLWGGDGG